MLAEEVCLMENDMSAYIPPGMPGDNKSGTRGQCDLKLASASVKNHAEMAPPGTARGAGRCHGRQDNLRRNLCGHNESERLQRESYQLQRRSHPNGKILLGI